MQATRTEAQRTRETLAIFAVALMFAWPAIVNQYPIVFSDTHAFLVQAGQPRMVWDKPWTYGPFLLALHGGTTLWLPLAAQVLIVSHLLWLLAASFGHATALRHVVLGIMLAAGSAAPWFASLLMPDVFAPITVIALYLLAFPGALGIWQRRWVMLLGTAAIAFHLTHLVLAAAGLAVVLVLRWRALPRTMVQCVSVGRRWPGLDGAGGCDRVGARGIGHCGRSDPSGAAGSAADGDGEYAACVGARRAGRYAWAGLAGGLDHQQFARLFPAA